MKYESDLRIKEHYTDTAGFTDHVFALMHLLGFRFAPRIRDLADKRLFVPQNRKNFPAIDALIGRTINDFNMVQTLPGGVEIVTLTAGLRKDGVIALIRAK